MIRTLGTMADRMGAEPLDKAALGAVRAALATRMKEIRGATNLSQKEAAERAGITLRNWGRIENGELNPRLDSLLRIQRALGIESLDGLFAPTTGDLLRGTQPAHQDRAGHGEE